MKLEEGRNAFVSLIDKTTGEILYTANLVDDILMFREMRANRRIAWNVTMIFP